MGIFDQLAEARIQDWIRRGRPHPEGVRGHVDGGSLEAQLLGEIIALRESARDEADDELRAHLLKEAGKREVQLFVLLERSGRPLAAKQLAERLQQIR